MESLVVGAVIAVLIALLLPVLGRFKTSALNVECLNHLRQLGVVAHAYSAEHDGAIVFTYAINPPPGEKKAWYDVLNTYLQASTNDKRSVLSCPQAVRIRNLPKGTRTYSLNTFVCPHQVVYPEARQRKLQEIRETSKLIFAGDGAWLSGSLSRYAADMTFGGQHPDPVHSGKANILFFDNHIAPMLPEEYSLQKYWRIEP